MVIEKGVRNNGLVFRSEAVVVVGIAFIRSSRALSDDNFYIRKARHLFMVLHNFLEPLIWEYFSRICRENSSFIKIRHE